MLKFKKDFNVKIILLVVAVLFLFNSIVYGIDIPTKSYLRVPVGGADTYKRLTEAIKTWEELDRIKSASSETGQKVKKITQEALVLFNPNTPGQCADASRWIADKLNKLGITNRERAVNIPFDASKEIEKGNPTTSHTILEAIFDGALWVIDTQLIQFTLPERNKLELPEGFVSQYVYQASDYYDKVPAFSDSMCIERINMKLEVFKGFESSAELLKQVIPAAVIRTEI